MTLATIHIWDELKGRVDSSIRMMFNDLSTVKVSYWVHKVAYAGFLSRGGGVTLPDEYCARSEKMMSGNFPHPKNVCVNFPRTE